MPNLLVENYPTRDDFWILATVLDIRNFTELVSRVDEITRTNYLPPTVRKRILASFRSYVAETQSAVVSRIMELAKTIGQPYAIKPTGDGLLFAIALQDVDDDFGESDLN